MIWRKVEGGPVRYGLNIMCNRYSFGFILRLRRNAWRVRYSRSTGIFYNQWQRRMTRAEEEAIEMRYIK